MKKCLVFLFAVIFVLQMAACTTVPEESDVSEVSADVSEPAVSKVPDRNGYKTALTSFCKYETSVKPATTDSGLLTDGEFETVSLNTDRFVRYSAKTEIVVDLGAHVDGIADFEVHYLVGIGKGSEPSLVTVSVSDDKSEFTEVGKVVPASHPQRNDPVIDNAVIKLDETVGGRYIKFTVNPKSGNMLMIQEVIAFSYTSVTPNGEAAKAEYTSAPENVGFIHPTWSFETLMPFIGATDDEWDEHFDYLKNAGFEGLIILNSASYDGSLMSATTIERCLKECSERGMATFIGLNMPRDAESLLRASEGRTEFLTSLEKNATILMNSYATKYKDSFRGFYFGYELSNGAYKDNVQGCADLVNGAIEILDRVAPGMPMLLSPFTTSWGGNAQQLKNNLTVFFEKTNFRSNDIYCPQDSVGAGLTALADSESYYAVMKGCCEKEGIELWANIENFVISSPVPGFSADTIAAPISRFVKQIEAAAPYITGCSTFTFEAYSPDKVGNYTIYTDVSYFYDNYLAYLNTGKAPAEQAPEILEVTASEPADGYIKITVRMKTPSYRVMTVTCTSDAKVRSLGRYYMTQVGNETYLSFREKVGTSGEGKIFSFRSYDFSGKSSAVFNYGYKKEVEQLYGAAVDRTKSKKDIAVSKSYTCTVAATHANGDSGAELTDGQYGSGNSFGDEAWSGYNVPTSITVDLGSVQEGIGDIILSVLDGGLGAIFEPSTMEISVSSDGKNYYSVYEAKGAMSADSKLYAKKIGLESEYCVRARYIRIDLTAGGWMFFDEIEVNVYG